MKKLKQILILTVVYFTPLAPLFATDYLDVYLFKSPEEKGKKIHSCEDAEKIVKKLQKVLEDDGYFIKPKFCGKNPSLYIAMK